MYRNSEIAAAHPDMSSLARKLDAWVERCEGEALRACDLHLWPSRWIKEAAQTRYGLPLQTGHLVPWGANIDPPPPPAVKKIEPDAPLHLLLVGRDWFAKGGPLAFETMQALRGRGVDARLTVIGCQPPPDHLTANVTVHTQLNKAVPEEKANFDAAFAQAHFLVQPSHESYGFVFCEASAHGLPSICLRVGGVPVRDGVNGFALPLGSDAEDFAGKVLALVANPDDYTAVSHSARIEYEERLNWDAWGKATADILRSAVEQKQRI